MHINESINQIAIILPWLAMTICPEEARKWNGHKENTICSSTLERREHKLGERVKPWRLDRKNLKEKHRSGSFSLEAAKHVLGVTHSSPFWTVQLKITSCVGYSSISHRSFSLQGTSSVLSVKEKKKKIKRHLSTSAQTVDLQQQTLTEIHRRVKEVTVPTGWGCHLQNNPDGSAVVLWGTFSKTFLWPQGPDCGGPVLLNQSLVEGLIPVDHVTMHSN